MIRLGVNLDHVATLRQARKTYYPSPIHAVSLAELGGADNITCHLREDRRHIQDSDVFLINKESNLPLNFEMAATKEMLTIAMQLKPKSVTLVPEKRQELTTEGGLSFKKDDSKFLCDTISCLREQGSFVALFVEPEKESIEKSRELGAQAIEIHTGNFCERLENTVKYQDKYQEVLQLSAQTRYASSLGLRVHVGHGINYTTAQWFQLVEKVEEANIGHAIISRAIFCGLEKAVASMKDLLNDPKNKPIIL